MEGRVRPDKGTFRWRCASGTESETRTAADCSDRRARVSTRRVLASARAASQWPATTCFNPVASVLAPDVRGTQAFKSSSDLPLGAEVLVPIGQRVVRVQERQLALKIIVKRKSMVIGRYRRDPAQERLRDSIGPHRSMKREEDPDKTLRPLQPRRR